MFQKPYLDLSNDRKSMHSNSIGCELIMLTSSALGAGIVFHFHGSGPCKQRLSLNQASTNGHEKRTEYDHGLDDRYHHANAAKQCC